MLQADALACERGGRTLFTSLNLHLHAGEALRIAGANGSGKTSLLRILCGLLPPAEGRVRWKGEELGALREEYSKQLVYLGHAPAVKDDLTAAENLSIWSRLAGDSPSEAQVASALERFGVANEARVVKRLSQGQRRRAALARLGLSASRPLWLLDEPFAALDAQGIAVIGALLQQHLERGGAVVFTTHQDPGIAASRVIELG